MIGARAVGGAGEGGEGVEDGAEEIGLEDGVFLLQHHREALKAHAGVDVRLLQRGAFALGILIELHEHEVPDLKIALAAVAAGAAVGVAAAEVRAAVVVDLGVGAAGTGGAGRPPPVVGEPRDAARWEAGDLLPVARRLVVVGVDGGEEALGGDAVVVGQQIPGVGDRLALEILADGEVAEHLEEGEVRGVADGFDVGGAEAFLHGGQPVARRLFLAEEIGDHLLHAGGGQQHGGIIARDQRGTGHAVVPVLLEVAKKGGAQCGAARRDAGRCMCSRRTACRPPNCSKNALQA